LYSYRSIKWFIDNDNYRDGYTNYADKRWVQSEIIRKLSSLPPSTPIYTNGQDAIYILTGKHSSVIPQKVYPLDSAVNHSYSSQLTSMQERLKNQNGVLVYFNTLTYLRPYLPSEDELKEELPLNLLEKGDDGSIYTVGNKK
jgi:hypothetical protein